MKKYVLFILILCVLLISCKNGNNQADAYGNFEAEEIMVSSEANGKLLLFKIQEGDRIVENEIVGVIDTTVLSIQMDQLLVQKDVVRSKIAQVNAQLDVYETQKRNVEVEKKRVEKLLKDGAATEKQMDDINAQLRVIQSQIELAKTQLSTIRNEIRNIDKQRELLRIQIGKCYIKNPINGIVLEKYNESNELVVMGKGLYKIASMDQMFLRAYVSESQLSEFSIGDTVDVMFDVADNQKAILKGKINWVSASAEFTPKIVQTSEERINMVYPIKVLVENNGTIKIGMPGEVKF